MIPTTIGLIVAHHKRAKSEGGEAVTVELQPSHPVTAFVWGAVNSGDYTDIARHIDPDFSVRLNGHALSTDDLGGPGPVAFAVTLDSWRALVPDLHWSLLDEVVSKQRDRIAVRFAVSGTQTGSTSDFAATGHRLRYEVAAFLHLEQKRLREIHQFVVLQAPSAALGDDQD